MIIIFIAKISVLSPDFCAHAHVRNAIDRYWNVSFHFFVIGIIIKVKLNAAETFIKVNTVRVNTS